MSRPAPSLANAPERIARKCSKCGVEPRIPGLSWGRRCMNESRNKRRRKS